VIVDACPSFATGVRRRLLNMVTLRRRALSNAREASSLLDVNHVEVLCAYYSSRVFQEGGG
jgi:hypothetical protein